MDQQYRVLSKSLLDFDDDLLLQTVSAIATLDRPGASDTTEENYVRIPWNPNHEYSAAQIRFLMTGTEPRCLVVPQSGDKPQAAPHQQAHKDPKQFVVLGKPVQDRAIWLMERFGVLQEAISTRIKKDARIPLEWAEEYNGLIEEFKYRSE